MKCCDLFGADTECACLSSLSPGHNSKLVALFFIFSHLTDFPVFPVCTLLHFLFPFFNEFYYVCVLLQPVREEVESRTERTVSGK